MFALGVRGKKPFEFKNLEEIINYNNRRVLSTWVLSWQIYKESAVVSKVLSFNLEFCRWRFDNSNDWSN